MMRGEQKVTASHRQRVAIVYIRQSTLMQVREHTESTARQYGLVQEAARLGWPAADIEVIDADLGLSGRTVTHRDGFKHLVARVCLGEVGAVFGLEVSRLARSNADLSRLLELARLTDTLVIDADGVYDLSDINDRLLLGLKSQMSEALCRRRHKASYADLRIMPRTMPKALVKGGETGGLVGIIHRVRSRQEQASSIVSRLSPRSA
jgi:hypothetical protein